MHIILIQRYWRWY